MVGNIFAEGEGGRGGANSDDIKTDVVFLIILIPWHHGSYSCGLLIDMNAVGLCSRVHLTSSMLH
jgi:hypothetical protein